MFLGRLSASQQTTCCKRRFRISNHTISHDKNSAQLLPVSTPSSPSLPVLSFDPRSAWLLTRRRRACCARPGWTTTSLAGDLRTHVTVGFASHVAPSLHVAELGKKSTLRHSHLIHRKRERERTRREGEKRRGRKREEDYKGGGEQKHVPTHLKRASLN